MTMIKDRRILFYAFIAIFTAGVLATASFIGRAQNGDESAPQGNTTLTENDFVNDPSLFAVPEVGVVATFLENPNSISEPDDTGTVGMDIIPFKYASGMNQTFCWEDENKESRHVMTLVDSTGTEVLRVQANGDCVTQFINQGDYEMHIQHDDSGEEVFATVFSIPEGDADNSFETVLSTNKCQGCDLSGANLSNAVLTDVNMSGADLTDADLSNADLSGANLSDTLLVGSDLTDANLTGADLSEADLTNALTANTNFTDANLMNAISFDESKLAKESITAQEEPTPTPTPGESDPCPDEDMNALMPGMGEDLVLSKACKVPAGIYQYGNINIVDGGSLTFMDENINFWAKSILIQNGGSLIAGSEGNPIGTNGQITIHLYGEDKGPGGKGITCKTADGKLDVMCGVDNDTWMSNEPPNPDSCNPTTDPAGVNDCFYRYHPLPVDTGDENGYFGYKVIAVSYGGTLQLFGKKGMTPLSTNPEPSNSGKSWVRLADGHDLKKDADTLVLERAVDWQPGDHIVVTTTDYLPGHSEELTIKTVSMERKMITVNEKFQYPHNGTTYKYPSDISRTGIQAPEAETRAAVALLTRSIRIVSGPNSDTIDQSMLNCETKENPADCFPVKDGYFGGHTIARQGFKTFQVQGVEFYQLGQGGRLGRYPVHFHLARKTPPDTFVKDCSIHDSMTRFITLHATQDVLLARNVGYQSIGHGYYLEDGTEINNKLYSNIGILARSAAQNGPNEPNPLNPRKVPGILSSPKVCSVKQTKRCESNNDCTATEGTCITYPSAFPYLADWVHPTVFWIMNGWNDFEYNMAAGAGACGACYWPVDGRISGPSKDMFWTSYASIQRKNAGAAPYMKFKGNYCTTAMNSFNTTDVAGACHGFLDGSVRLEQVPNTFAAVPNPDRGLETEYPIVEGLPAYTRCEGENTDCSEVAKCDEDHRKNCMVLVLDGYTSSFNWGEKNFSAIWLRPRWSLVQNSVITDVQQAGLTFVTGGDYTHSSVIPGNWMLARKTVFIGTTQPGNRFASEAGPFNPDGLACDNSDANYCLSREQQISMQLDSFGMNQRFFNIYDGPSLQDSNAYLDIKKTFIKDCPFPNDIKQCNNSKWMYGRVLGLPGGVNPEEQKEKQKKTGYLPNAAIAWKQSNGFYYPPAFHSTNLFFKDVDIRHFVIEPLFAPETATEWFKTSTDVDQHYATWASDMFVNFTAIDRQTILNDDDGSLTGLANTVSVNEDPFFNAPVETIECLSDETAKTSPYEHITTVVYPDCARTGKCEMNHKFCDPKDAGCPCNNPDGNDSCEWSANCTRGAANAPCYGVPLFRQFLTKSENEMTNPDTKIRMMGPKVYGRINLTANHGKYYISTTDGPVQQNRTPLKTIFRKGDTYYVFLVFSKPTSRQTYQLYVGAGADVNSVLKNVEAVGANLPGLVLEFDKICTDLDSSSSPLCQDDPMTDTKFPKNWDRKYDSGSGILTVTMDLSKFETQFDNAKHDICQPGTFCVPSGNHCKCSSSLDSDLKKECDEGKICEEWAVKDIDCPVFEVTENDSTERRSRCVGFSFKIPQDGNFVADGTDRRPKDMDPCFPRNEDWNVAWTLPKPETLAGTCAGQPVPFTQFCNNNSAPIMSSNVIMGTEGDDVLIGTPESDIIYGLGGNDIIEGRNGSDWISGGPGDDEIRGGRGDDIIFGDEGNDFLKGGGGKDELDGGSETDIVKGGRGKDTCVEGEKVRACEQ